MELGLYTFVDWTKDPVSGERVSAQQRFSDMLEEAAIADQLGLDVYGVGEHHRKEFIVSAPAVVLAAVAMRTKKIRLTSAVTVLSSDDPVRVYQQYATLDLLSGGRAEIMAGRGSFIESFPLFGYDLADYDTLFQENLELLLQINSNEFVTWKGGHRAAIRNLGVYPRAMQEKIPVWLAVGGTPESFIRGGTLNLPLALAIIGGYPKQFVPHIKLYREAALAAGHDMKKLQIGINGHVFIADTSQQAADDTFPAYAQVMSAIGRERGWAPLTREAFEASRSPQAALLVGSPNEVAEKIIYQYELFGNTRFLAQMTVGTLPHDKVMRSIELFGTKVAEQVRKYTTEKENPVHSSQEK